MSPILKRDIYVTILCDIDPLTGRSVLERLKGHTGSPEVAPRVIHGCMEYELGGDTSHLRKP